MILSVSRRTDIPNYYSEWFLNRIKEGFLYVRNPMNPHQISKIDISLQMVDCIVFWTKNPQNMIKRLEYLGEYQYYFQFTLTGYGKDIEPKLPDKRSGMVGIFKSLSERAGKERVIWRYDPILITPRYTAGYHVKAFEEIAGNLAGYTERVVISFLDFYAKTRRNTKGLEIREMANEHMVFLAGEMARIAKAHGLAIETCGEQLDFGAFGISRGSCIDKRLVERLLGCRITGQKDKSQREACGCLESVEVGAYNTCLNGCRYCYANFNDEKVQENMKNYDVNSPLLCGSIGPDDKLTDRKVKLLRETCQSFQ